MRDMLRAFGTARQARGLPLEVSAEDHMDDGSPIRLRVQINLNQVSLRRGYLLGHHWHARRAADLSPTLVGRVARCLISAAQGRRCSATSTRRGPSRCLRSSTVFAVWLAATFHSTRCEGLCCVQGQRLHPKPTSPSVSPGEVSSRSA